MKWIVPREVGADVSDQKFHIEEAIGVGWETTRSNLNALVVLTIVGVLAIGAPSYLATMLQKSNPFMSIIFRIAGVIMSLVVSLGAIRISLRLHDGQPVAIGDLFATELPLFRRYLVGTIAYALIVGFGLVLFVIPGIYFASRFGFYGYFIVDSTVSPYEALARSDTMTHGARMDVILLGLALVVLNALGAMLLFIGLLVSIPMSLIALAHAYRSLSTGMAFARAGRSREQRPQWSR